MAAIAALPALAEPIARDDSFTTAPSTPLSVAATGGVLVNDSPGEENGDPLEAVLVRSANNGTLVLGQTGGFFYLPRIGFTGSDTFLYQARQGDVVSNFATVTITVLPASGGNVPPVAITDNYAVDEGRTLSVAAANGVLANDSDANGDPLTAVLTTNVANGTLTLQPDGSFSYTPPDGFVGTVTFAYQADDTVARSNTATVVITVNEVNEPPVAAPDGYQTSEDTPLSIPAAGVLGNDSDPDGDALTAVLAGGVGNGGLALNPDGSFNYTPPSNFNGTTSFTYRARDGELESAATTVTIEVAAVNDAPFITNSPPTSATEDVTYRYTLAATDPDQDTLTITAPTLPGWLRFAAPATISGTPSDADAGTHRVLMRVTDGTAAPVEQSFEITVQAVDNAPTIAPIPEQTATENTPYELDLAPFVDDSDTEASALTYAATSGVPSGLTLSATGQLTGTPEVGSSIGTHTVRFTVSDAESSVPGELMLAVLPAGRVDLAVSMSAAPNPVTLDTPAAWTITVTNRAPDVGAQAVILDAAFTSEVPFTFDAPTTAGCVLTPSGNQNALACSLGPLAGGASTTITLTGRGNFAGDVFGTAEVGVTGTGALDETPGNDTTQAALSVAQRVAGVPAQRIVLAGRAIAAGDFDGDGFDELVVATGDAQGLVLFANVADPANAGRRTFATPPQALGGEALTADIGVGDFDGDGDLDIVTAARSGAPNRVFVRSGGTFSASALGEAATDSRAVAIGDVNGDSFPDLAFASSGSVSVLRNSGSGAAFAAATAVGAHDARDVLLVNLFGDALPELVVASADGDAAVYRNVSGSFALETTLATGPATAVESGDFNGDGRADLVFARATAAAPGVPSALVWLNTSGSGAQFFVSDELGAAPAAELLVHDFNLDAQADVLALNGYGARIFANAGAANGTFTLRPQQLSTPAALGAAIGRFSSDDRTDIAVVSDALAVFIDDGGGEFGQPDSNPPMIQLRGDAVVNLTIDSPYSDAGATASDREDGDITSRIVVTNGVNTTVLGSYTVTYSVTDLSGNAAVPVTRTVNVQPQPAASEGGGGGAVGYGTLLALLLAAALAAQGRRARGSRWTTAIRG